MRLPLHAPQITGMDFSYRAYFRDARKLTETAPAYEFVTFRGVEKGSKGVVIAMPVLTHRGEFNGVILFTIKVNELINGFIPLQSTSSEFWIVDDEGHVLYHPGYSPGTVISELPGLDITFKAFLKEAKAGKPCMRECISPEGVETIMASFPLEIAGQHWSVVVAAPVKAVSKLLVQFNLKYSLGAMFVLLAITGGSFFTIYTIHRWNRELESTVKLRTKELAESETKMREVVETVNDWIWEIDIEGKYVYASPRVRDILGYEPGELIGRTPFSLMPEDEANKIKAFFQEKVTKGEPFNNLENTNTHRNGKHVVLETSGVPVFDDNGRLAGFRGVDRDITARKKTEEKLKASLKEKELLLREIHHRVKNNMQIISSLLKQQMGYMNDRKGIEIFRDSQDRINSMALIHEQLYQSDNLMNIDLSEYVRHLVSTLFQSFGVNVQRIAQKIHIKDISLGVDTAIPCGLVINELVSNSLKYAFPEGREGTIEIDLKKAATTDSSFELSVRDDGVGMSPDIDIRNTGTLGLQLVNILAEHQLRGRMEVDRSDGTEFRIFFKEIKYKKRI